MAVVVLFNGGRDEEDFLFDFDAKQLLDEAWHKSTSTSSPQSVSQPLGAGSLMVNNMTTSVAPGAQRLL